MTQETRTLTQPLFDYLSQLSEMKRYDEIMDIVANLNEFTKLPKFYNDPEEMFDDEGITSHQFGEYIVQKIYYNNDKEIDLESMQLEFEDSCNMIDTDMLPIFEPKEPDDDLPF